MKSLKDRIDFTEKMSSRTHTLALVFASLAIIDLVLFVKTQSLLFGLFGLLCLTVSFVFRVFRSRFEREESKLYEEIKEIIRK